MYIRTPRLEADHAFKAQLFTQFFAADAQGIQVTLCPQRFLHQKLSCQQKATNPGQGAQEGPDNQSQTQLPTGTITPCLSSEAHSLHIPKPYSTRRQSQAAIAILGRYQGREVRAGSISGENSG